MKSKRYEGKDLRLVLAAMVTDQTVLNRIAKHWNEEGLFDVPYANLIGSWCVKHLKRYGEAPSWHLRHIFEEWVEKGQVDKSTYDGVKNLLCYISDEWSQQGQVNSDYILDVAGELFNRVRIRKVISEAEECLEENKVGQALSKLNSTTRVELGVGAVTDPTEDFDVWQRVFDKDRNRSLVRYSGALARFFEDAFLRDRFVSFMAPDKSCKCVTGDTQIVLSDGSVKTIADVVKNSLDVEVLSVEIESNKVVSLPIVGFCRNGTRECFRLVTCKGKSVKATSNHRFFTDLGWSRLDRIRIGSKVLVLNDNEDLSWEEVEDIHFVGMEETFDVEVQDTHNFIGNGIVCHNSFLLMDVAYRAALAQCNVAYFEVGDLSQEEVYSRLGQRASGLPLYDKTVVYPIGVRKVGRHKGGRFGNQEHQDEERESHSDEGGEGDKSSGKKPYVVEVEDRKLEGLTDFVAFRSFRKACRSSNSFRVSCYPSSTISADGIHSVLSEWAREGWICDVVVIDYADILAPPYGVRDTLDQIDETWKRLKRISHCFHCCVVTASQSNAAAYKSSGGLLSKKHFSGRKTKLAHVDGMVGINVDDEDRKQGVLGLNWIVRRNTKYSEGDVCYVAGCLDIGRPTIVSDF